eukprot:14028529-Alexandrium_andersonii.AAC.1
MEDIETEADDGDVAIVSQPERSSGVESAARTRRFSESLRQRATMAGKVKKTAGRKGPAPAGRKLPQTAEPARARAATPARPTDTPQPSVPPSLQPTGRAL